jgi:hypothetical protein
MTDYRVSYTTPVAAGTAVVDAEGILAARDEARRAAAILTGHPIEHIAVTQVADADGVSLWVASDQPTPEAWQHVGTR